jgi:Peptidase inhibitor family I36
MTTPCRTLPVTGEVAVAVLLLSGCMKSLPTAPSLTALTSGVAIYEHADFAGDSAVVTEDLGDLKDFHGPCPGEVTSTGIGSPNWNDCMSSLKVAPGWRVTVYRDDDFDGESFDATSDVPNLALVRGSCGKGGLNDCITSIRVRRQ